MTKLDFIVHLRARLSGLPQADVEERLCFYSEMIDDRVEEGATEEQAVAELGSVEEIASQIVCEIPFVHIVKERIKPKKRLRGWEITLLALGSPLWLALLITVFAAALSVYAVLWSLVISLWATFGVLVGGAVGGVLSGPAFFLVGHRATGAVLFAAGLVLAGLSIFLFWGCKAATKGILCVTKAMVLGTKKCLIRKEDAQ